MAKPTTWQSACREALEHILDGLLEPPQGDEADAGGDDEGAADDEGVADGDGEAAGEYEECQDLHEADGGSGRHGQPQAAGSDVKGGAGAVDGEQQACAEEGCDELEDDGAQDGLDVFGR
ncbi:MAG UNVERIFIED_CONTAM: hypothetical protein LOD86_10700 [Thermobifida fusca]